MGSPIAVSPDAARIVLDTLTQAANETLTALTTDLYAGAITAAEWETAVATVIKNAHVGNGIFGAGGVANTGPVEYGRMGANIREQYNYLHNFAEQIVSGDVSEAQALNRVQLYGKASEAAYWREAARGEDRAEWNDLPMLHNSPRDGQTRCLTNCMCEVVPTDAGLEWQLNAQESCEDCEDLAAGGPYRPGDM